MSTTGLLDAADLLTGPRGRRLCLELARRDDDAVAGAVFQAAYALDPGAGTSVVMFGPGAENRPMVTPQDVAAAVAHAPIPSLDGTILLHALCDAVAFARYWQAPDGEDVLAATAPVRAALRNLAAAVVAAPDARWWTAGLDITAQCRVTWIEEGRPPAAPVPDPGAALATWRSDAIAEEEESARDRPTDPTAPWSGVWWSTPPSILPHTSRTLDNQPGGPGAGGGLARLGERTGDACGGAGRRPRARDRRPRRVGAPVPPPPAARTASRRHDWFRATGRADVAWVQPDWAAFAAEADAVHLPVSGYLATAGRAIPVGRGVASVLAGWGPDATYWLTGPPAAAGPAREWSYHRDVDRWVPA